MLWRGIREVEGEIKGKLEGNRTLKACIQYILSPNQNANTATSTLCWHVRCDSAQFCEHIRIQYMHEVQVDAYMYSVCVSP